MKILYFSFDYCSHDHRFLSALANTEHDVFYVRLQQGARITEVRPVPASIREVAWVGGHSLFRWSDLPGLVIDFHRLTREIRPDIIHAGPIQTCGLIATLAGAGPRLIMSWGFDLMQDVTRNGWWRWATRYVLHRASWFISDCEATHQRAVAYGMAHQRTTVFPWGVDLEHFTPAAPPRDSSREFTLFCNRSWEPRYGVDVLAKAFSLLVGTFPGLRLLLLGGGSQEHVIRRIFQEAGVSDRVTFAGHVPQEELPGYYQRADLYISPSHVDGSSVSLMEALACGLPCLVSDIPANQEWVHEGENGWLFPDGDMNALAGKIALVLGWRDSLIEIGQAARRTAEAKANWRVNFQILLETYQRVLTR